MLKMPLNSEAVKLFFRQCSLTASRLFFSFLEGAAGKEQMAKRKVSVIYHFDKLAFRRIDWRCLKLPLLHRTVSPTLASELPRKMK